MTTNGKGEDYLSTLREMARDRARLEAEIAEMAGALRGKRKALATLLQAEQRYLYEITGVTPLPLYDAASTAPHCYRCGKAGDAAAVCDDPTIADSPDDLIRCDAVDCGIIEALGVTEEQASGVYLCGECYDAMRPAAQEEPAKRGKAKRQRKAAAAPESPPRTLTPEPIAGLGVTPEQLDAAYVTGELVGTRTEPARVKAFTMEPNGRRWVVLGKALSSGGAREWRIRPLCSAERFGNDYPGTDSRLVPGTDGDRYLGVQLRVGRHTLIMAGDREERLLVAPAPAELTEDTEPISRNTLLNEVAALSLPDVDALDHAGLRTVGDLLDKAATLGLRLDAEGRPYRDDTQHVYTVLQQTKRLSREGALALGDRLVESEIISREEVPA